MKEMTHKIGGVLLSCILLTATAPLASAQDSGEFNAAEAGLVVGGIGAGVAALGYYLASEQEDEADDCRRINAGGGATRCTNQSDLDDEVDQWETVGVVGLVGAGIGGVMILSDTAAAAGFTGVKAALDRHLNSISYAANGEHWTGLSYHSPDIPGLALSYSAGGTSLSKTWRF